MFNKNLRYYRLKKGLTKKQLAKDCEISAMAITHYESGARNPEIKILKKMAEALDVRISDFLLSRNDELVFKHGEFRKSSSLSQLQQDYIRESVEEYFGRFYSALDVVDVDALPDAPECNILELSNDVEKNASLMRKHLGLALTGPIDELIAVLENKGILVYKSDIGNDNFSGMNGFVNNRPYIIINSDMSTERNRSTIAHELAHLFFKWDKSMSEKEIEKKATAISGAFLFPKEDVIRELGIKRTAITSDMLLVCKEYGISMWLLTKRAQLANVISAEIEKNFYIKATKMDWRKNEPTRIPPEEPTLFSQLVYRAVNEDDISVQRGAELLNIPFAEVARYKTTVEG